MILFYIFENDFHGITSIRYFEIIFYKLKEQF